MGNVLLARILEYFNGTLFLDDNYRFCVFFIENYIDFYKMTLEEVVEKSKISKEAILNFLSHLGFDDYASFQDKLYADVILRQDQIRSRMLGLKWMIFLNKCIYVMIKKNLLKISIIFVMIFQRLKEWLLLEHFIQFLLPLNFKQI